MYPMSSFGMTGLPSIMPGVGTLKRLLEGATGTGRDILGGTGKAVAPAFGGIGELFGLNKIPGAIGNIFNKWNFGPFRGERVSTAIPAGDGGSGGRQIDLADAVQPWQGEESKYGRWIGRDPNMAYTTDFIDNDGDGIDDRWQTGPGMPNMNPLEGGQNKLALTPTPITTPAPFDYSQLGPHFTSPDTGHYANQGIPGQAWPQFDYWNQIARTFPGMR